MWKILPALYFCHATPENYLGSTWAVENWKTWGMVVLVEATDEYRSCCGFLVSTECLHSSEVSFLNLQHKHNLECMVKHGTANEIVSNLPFIPRSLAAWIGVLPTSLFNLDTTVSAGWETTAQKTPAMYPAAKVTTSCSDFVHSDLGFGTTYLYKASTVLSKQANFIMVYGICLIQSGGRPL